MCLEKKQCMRQKWLVVLLTEDTVYQALIPGEKGGNAAARETDDWNRVNSPASPNPGDSVWIPHFSSCFLSFKSQQSTVVKTWPGVVIAEA